MMLLFRRLAYYQVLLGVVAACLAHKSISLALIAGTLCALSWYVVEGPNGKALPKWLIMLAALMASGVLAFELYQSQASHPIVTLSHYMIWLQVILLYAPKNNRDYAQLLMLSLMLMIGSSIIGVSMLFALTLIVYCLVALFTVLMFQLKIANDLIYDHNKQAALPGSQVARPRPVACPGYRSHFRVLALCIGLSTAIIAVMVFLLVPRQGKSAWQNNLAGRNLRHAAGFTTSIDLDHAPPRLGSSQMVMSMSIEHDDPKINNLSQPAWLMRGSTMDVYNAQTHSWKSSMGEGSLFQVLLDLPSQGKTLLELPEKTPAWHAQITLLGDQQRYLFTLDRPISQIRSTSLETVSFNPVNRHFRLPQIFSSAMVYQLTCPDPLPKDYSIVQGYGDHVAVKNMHVDRLDPKSALRFGHAADYARGWQVQAKRVTELAEQILAQAGLKKRDRRVLYDPQDPQRCDVLVAYLSGGGGFVYELGYVPDVPGPDPLIDFLFVNRKGHCELFASGFTAMARSVGMRARLISGFRASERNRLGGYYVVREKNAHAWAEVEMGPSKWQTYDPSPAALVQAEHQGQTGVLPFLRDVYEYLEYAWARHFVAYNLQAQQKIIGQVNQTLQQAASQKSVWGQVMQWIKTQYQSWSLNNISFWLIGVIMIAIAVCVLTFVRIVVVYRRRLETLQLACLPRHQRRNLVKELHFYLTMINMLDRHGHVRPVWQSPFGFAKQLTEQHSQAFDPVVALTELFYEIRFGYRHLTQEHKKRVRVHLRRLDQVLSKK